MTTNQVLVYEDSPNKVLIDEEAPTHIVIYDEDGTTVLVEEEAPHKSSYSSDWRNPLRAPTSTIKCLRPPVGR